MLTLVIILRSFQPVTEVTVLYRQEYDCTFNYKKEKKRLMFSLPLCMKAQQKCQSMFSSAKLRRIHDLSAKYDELFN